MKNKFLKIAAAAIAVAALLTLTACTLTATEQIVVSFESNGGTECTDLVLNKKHQKLPIPTREGYEFEGWYCDDGVFKIKITNAMLSDGSIIGDLKVYAKWKKIVYQIVFESNGGSECPPMTLDGSESTLPKPVKEDYEFVGWFFDNETFENEATDEMLSEGNINSNAVLYAKWKKSTLNLTFISNGGSECDPMIVDGTAKTLPVPTLEGYDFKGWYFDNDTFEQKATDAIFSDGSLSSDTVLFAKWEKAKHTVTVYVDGALYEEIPTEHGEPCKKPEMPDRAGYVFDGWFTDGTYENAYDFTAPVDSSFDLYGRYLQETSGDLLKFALANQYFGYDCCGVTGVVDGATLPENLVIPSFYDDYPVVVIFWDAFKGKTELKSAYIPDSVTTVTSGVFANCTSLSKVRMSENIVECGDGAFSNTALYENAENGYFYVGSVLADFKGKVPENFEVTVKEGTRVIADRVFWIQEKVIKVNLPASLVYVGFNAFLRNPITEYTVPAESETYTVQDGALFSKDMTHFVYYPSGNDRESYEIPSSVVTVGDEAFQHLYHLKRLVFPDSVKTIGDGVCDESQVLEEVVFGAGIESVGDGTFNAAKSLKRVIVKSPTPFPFGVYFISGSGVPKYEIYVTDEYLETYKTDAKWKTAASRMKPLSELPA